MQSNFKNLKLQKPKINKKAKIIIKQVKANNQTQWKFKQVADYASDVSVFHNKVSFGLPRVAQTIWPKQTARINIGWNIQSIPKDQMIHTLPSQELLMSDLISVPTSIQQFDKIGQLSQLILNNTNHPIQINLDGQMPRFVKLNLETQQIEQFIKDVNWGQIFHVVLMAATQILPIFL